MKKMTLKEAIAEGERTWAHYTAWQVVMEHINRSIEMQDALATLPSVLTINGKTYERK